MSNDNPFQILGDNQVPARGGQPVTEQDKSGSVTERIEKLINSSRVFLFMKGMPDMPMCGFSANVVSILNSYSVDFKSFSILDDMDIRQGVKEYSNWPTFPQLYINGKLIGGNDIIQEMYDDGELEAILRAS